MNNNSEKVVNRNIDWDDVENKISIICRKFSNIDNRFKDDLAQELRIHAYYYSDDYYDLQRKAIDYWRTLTRRVYPEIPYIDLELTAGEDTSDPTSDIYYESTVKTIKKELLSDVYESKSDINLNNLALKILDIILEDFDGNVSKDVDDIDSKIKLHKYRNGKINLSYIDIRLPDVNYKMISKAFNRLKEVAQGLKEMGLI